jgi:uncharacterized protein
LVRPDKIEERDREVANLFTKDAQLTAVRGARRYLGFGGGMHGYRALEGTFLGGCLFSGRTAGRHLAKTVI